MLRYKMLKKYNILLVILARGGSKRIKNKNIKSFNKKPLFLWTIEQALRIDLPFTQTLLSTESEEIISLSKNYKKLLSIKRPKFLSKDNTSSVAVLRHIIKKINFSGHIILLQPTSPLRSDKDILNVIELVKNGMTPIVSVCQCLHNSLFITKENIKKKFQPIAKKEYNLFYPNGAIYSAHSSWIKKNESFYSKDAYTYIMPAERSIDIDYDYQFTMAEVLFKNLEKSDKINS